MISLLFNMFKLSKTKKIRLGKFSDLLAYVLSSLLIFFAGWLLAWSFASPVIEFIKPISQQELMRPLVLIATVVLNYLITKYKHHKIKN